jgi:hypothetical protein
MPGPSLRAVGAKVRQKPKIPDSLAISRTHLRTLLTEFEESII